MKIDIGDKYFEYCFMPELKYLASGLTYDEIAWKYYHGNKNKFVYAVRKIREKLNLHNREQILAFAFYNNLK